MAQAFLQSFKSHHGIVKGKTSVMCLWN